MSGRSGKAYPGFPIRAEQVISGVFAPARLGTGSSISTKFLRGDGTWQTMSVGDALTANPLSQFAPTTSAQLASVITDESGTGALVFANTPTLVTPVLGVATATSVNKVIITAPGTTATLTLANNSVFRTVGNDVIELTSTGDTALTLPESGFLMVGENNLSELDDPSIARTNIGLDNTNFSGTRYFGSATAGANTATINIGTSTGANSCIVNIGTAGGANTSQVNVGGTLNKYTLTAPATGATIALADNTVLATSGGHSLTFTTTGSTNVTLPNSGTLVTLAGFETLANKALVSPLIQVGGVNGTADIYYSGSDGAMIRLPIGSNGQALKISGGVPAWGSVGDALTSNSLAQFAATTATELRTLLGGTATGTGNAVFASGPTISDAILLTPKIQFSGTPGAVGDIWYLDNTSTYDFARLPIGSAGKVLTVVGGIPSWVTPAAGDALVANPLSQFGATTSLELKGVISDETGSGPLVFATSPTLTTPALGVATATSINGLTVTTTTGTLTLVNGSSLVIAGAFSNTLTTTDTTNVTLPTSGTLATLAGSETFTNKTLTSPTMTAPVLGTPASGTMTNVTGTATGLIAGTATNLAGGSGGTIPYQSAADTTAMLSNGTAGQYLQSNGTTLAPTWVTPAGLTGFTASLNTSSPNNTVNASMILASGGSTNQDAVVSPKGSGAFQLSLADSTATGGNKRGTNAIDLQTTRVANTDVASGTGSVVIGSYCSATGSNSVAIGVSCVASATGAFAHGGTATASGTYSQAQGYRSTASMYGQIAKASGYFSAVRDAQVSELIARRQTTNNTQSELYIDGSSLRIVIASGAAFAFEIRVFGSRTDAGIEVFHNVIQGTIVNAGGTTALEGTNVTTSITDTSGAVWSAVAEADNTNDALVIKVTGDTGKTIRWVASIKLIETTT